jgi:hypothetical protein
VSGEDAYRYLKYEAGVHRVQRVPATEKSGRVHTSTVSVAVLPQPEEVPTDHTAVQLYGYSTVLWFSAHFNMLTLARGQIFMEFTEMYLVLTNYD